MDSPFAQQNRYVYSQASRSNYRGYLHDLKYLLFISIILKQKEKLCRRIGLRTSNRDIFVKLLQFDVCKPSSLLVCVTPLCLSMAIVNIWQ